MARGGKEAKRDKQWGGGLSARKCACASDLGYLCVAAVPTARPQQWTTEGQGRAANRQGALFVPKGPWPAAELVRCAAEPLRPRPASQGVSSSRLYTVRPVPAVGGEACVRTRCWGPCHALRPKRPEKKHLIFFYCF
jgi:hypothetical protein